MCQVSSLLEILPLGALSFHSDTSLLHLLLSFGKGDSLHVLFNMLIFKASVFWIRVGLLLLSLLGKGMLDFRLIGPNRIDWIGYRKDCYCSELSMG